MLKKIAFFTYLLLITTLSLWPSDGLPDIALFPGADKIIHAGMYAGLTFILFWAWPARFSDKKQLFPLLAVFLWGFLMEFLQGFTHLGRTFDMTDELANTLGYIPGWICWIWIKRINTP
ncbi:MAG: VanZ family protein [Bacteroidota bacterium]